MAKKKKTFGGIFGAPVGYYVAIVDVNEDHKAEFVYKLESNPKTAYWKTLHDLIGIKEKPIVFSQEDAEHLMFALTINGTGIVMLYPVWDKDPFNLDRHIKEREAEKAKEE